MKALIRDTEIITEPFPEWVQGHLLWMATAHPNGDDYALCEDCPVQDPEPQDFDISEVQVPAPVEETEDGAPAVLVTTTKRVAVFNAERYNARKAQEAQE